MATHILCVMFLRRIPSLSASWTCCPELVGHEKCNWDMGSIGDREIQVHVNVTSQCGINVGNLFEVNTGNIGMFNQFKVT